MSEAGGSEDENDDDPDEHLVDREGTKDDLTVMPDCSSVVVYRSQNTRDLHFPLRIKAKISEYASNYAVSNCA